ncbi:HNH endonuclease [Macellibacteroides fermentans]|uniref:HNH endonuclease n=1 Tax=Parabacteroides chartae TaxID=1037355 RepID=A0A1T5CHV9_9BACT|nr:HNH endonuclease [Parabacteroides chartae]SKB59037.1 HNH endonuclease [Parabacteroides chartae]
MNYIILLSLSAIIVIIVITVLIINNKKRNNTTAPSIEHTEITNSILQTEDKEKEENPIEESSVSSETLTETPKFANTHGEKGFYKEKLEDPRWIKMRYEIRKRDGEKCQQCWNCVNNVYYLKDISDLPKITKISNDLYKAISAVFVKKEVIIKGLLSDNVPKKCNLIYYLKVYNKEMEIYQYGLERIKLQLSTDIPLCIPLEEIISCKEIISLTCYFDSSYSEKYFIPSIRIKYNPKIKYYTNVQTDDKIYLKFNLSYPNFGNKGEWSIHQNGFVVSFSSFGIPQQLGLNVHHRVYPKSGNPWDSAPEDLITLCSKCHQAEHERLGFKIPIKND